MPSIITWDDKVTFAPHPEIPHENKVTAEDMNEIKNSINGTIIDGGVVTFFKTASDISGTIDNPKLQDRKLVLIIGGGAIFEEGIHFEKGDSATIVTMINGNTLNANYSYTLFTTLV